MCNALHWHDAWKSSCFCNEICRSHFMTGEMFVCEVFFAEHISSMFSRSMCAWVVGDVGGDNCVTYLSTRTATTGHPIQPQPDILTIFVLALLANFPRMCCVVQGKIQIEAKVGTSGGLILMKTCGAQESVFFLWRTREKNIRRLAYLVIVGLLVEI